MKKKMVSVIGILTAVSMTVLAAGDSSMKGHSSLAKGVNLFGAHTGDNAAFFKPYASNALVSAAELHTPGWGPMQQQEGQFDWSLIDETAAVFKENNKKIAVRMESAGHDTTHVPKWVYMQYNVRAIMTEVYAFSTFEDDDDGKNRTHTGAVIEDAERVVAQRRSLLLDAGQHITLAGNSAEVDVWYGYDFRAQADSAVKVTAYKDGQVFAEAAQTLKAGETGSKMLEYGRDAITESQFDIRLQVESGSVVVDNVCAAPARNGFGSGNVTYPNYFDPVFIEKYTAFVKAFAARYRDNETIAVATVGGLGRWDEPALSIDWLENISDVDLNRQWKAYGYSDKRYVDHITGMMDMWKQALSGSHIRPMLQTVAFELPDGDPLLLSFTLLNKAHESDVLLKTNGISARYTEWGNKHYPFTVFQNRYKHDPDVEFFLEEGGQINNTTATVMGHPLSLFNRYVIDGTDHFWLYSNDINDPFVGKYLHTAAEQAGSALYTKYYNLFGKFMFTSSAARQEYPLYDQYASLFNYSFENVEYGVRDGRPYVSTTDEYGAIHLSLDDHQKHMGLYGAAVHVDYLDEGTDTFRVVAVMPVDENGEDVELGKITKTNTGELKTVSFYNTQWCNAQYSSGVNYTSEIILDDNGDGADAFFGVEMEFVPAREFKETSIAKAADNGSTKPADMNTPLTVSIPVPEGRRVSSIAVPVGAKVDVTEGYVNLVARAYAVHDGKRTLVASKDHYMPGTKDQLIIPVADAPSGTTAFEVEVQGLLGNACVYVTDAGTPAYEAFSYDLTQDEGNRRYKASAGSAAAFEAIKPFEALKMEGSGTVTVTLSRKLADGTKAADIFTGTIDLDKNELFHIEPQPAGVYELTVQGGDASFVVQNLIRLQAPAEALRYNMGKTSPDAWKALGDQPWVPVSNLRDMRINKDGAFEAYVAGENPVLETQAAFSMEAERTHSLHLVLKNETASPLAKLYWKTDKTNAYTEENSTLISLVANDDQYREYSWPIGQESTYKGNITGLRLVPVTGHTDTGRIAIKTMDVYQDWLLNYEYGDKLSVRDVPAVSGVQVKDGVPLGHADPGEDIGTGDGLPPLARHLIIAGSIVAGALIIGGGVLLWFHRKMKRKKRTT